MSLFICSKCGCVENTNCCTMGIQYVDGEVVDNGFPNMGPMEMRGYRNPDNIDDKSEPMMLCSECNTGKWHGEFEKRQAEPVEILISKFSKLSYITPLDHVVKLVKDDNVPCGYNLDPVIYTMIKQSNGNLLKHPLYSIYIKFQDTFNYDAVNELNEIADLLNPTEDEEKRIREISLMAMGNDGLMKAAAESKQMSEPKVRQRDKVPQETQEMLMKKAEEKRERKRLKKEASK